MSKYTTLQRFVKDVTHPYVIGFKMVLRDCLDHLQEQLTNINNRITAEIIAFQNSVIALDTSITNTINTKITLFNTTKYNTLNTAVTNHITRQDNPHVVKLRQVATISTSLPSLASSVDGDLCIIPL